MIDDISADRLANAICQDLPFEGKYVFVEGNNDWVLFQKFLSPSYCNIRIAHGKEKILEAYDILVERGYSEVAIGIIDSDFNNLIEVENSREFIFYTDTHDLETMIFSSDAFDSLVNLRCLPDRLKILVDRESKSLKEILLERTSFLGYLKLANHINKWGLLFKPKEQNRPELKIEDFIIKDDLKFKDVETMVKTVFNFSRGKVTINVEEKTVIEEVNKLIQNKIDLLQLCNGHDLAYIFALGLKKAFANLNANAVTASQIENELILAYESRHFASTNLYKSLKNYELSNGINLLTV